MKKITGILGIAAIAMAMFFYTNITNSSNEHFDLASIININTANAECISGSPDYYIAYVDIDNERVKVCLLGGIGCC